MRRGAKNKTDIVASPENVPIIFNDFVFQAFVSFAVGFRVFKNFDLRDPSSSKRLVSIFYISALK